MALSFPRSDVFTSAKFSTQVFDLKNRQELSRQANGVSRGKDLGSGLWSGSWSVDQAYFDDAVDFEAVIHSLDGLVHGFYAGDLRRPYPKADPSGALLGSNIVRVHSVQSGVAWRLKGLPAGYVISRGDYMSYDYGTGPSRALVQAMETVTADGTGVTPSFPIRAELRPGIAPEIVVTLKEPKALFTLLSDGFASGTTEGVVQSGATIQAIQRL